MEYGVEYKIDKLIENFEKRKVEMALYHHIDQIKVQKGDYNILSKMNEMIDTKNDIDKYPLFKLISWIIPFKNSISHMFTLMKYGSNAKKCILEIGTCHGSSAIALGIGAKMYGGNNPKLITVDIVQTECEAKGYFELFKEFLPSNRLIIQSDSKTFSFNEPVDLLYIDGGHEYDDVYADCEKYIPLVVVGGICIFHDAGTSNVSRAIAQFFDDKKDKIKFEKLQDNIIDSPINSSELFLYNNVGIGAIRIV